MHAPRGEKLNARIFLTRKKSDTKFPDLLYGACHYYNLMTLVSLGCGDFVKMGAQLAASLEGLATELHAFLFQK